MGSEHLYFYEDEVFRRNKKGNLELGMVIQNAEHVSSDEEDEEYSGVVRNGYIRVAWHPSGVEQVIQEKKVGLADRSLMPGDVVRRLIKGKDTQRGYCRSIHVESDVQLLGTNQVLLGVDSRSLSPVEIFMPGVVVVLRSWVGTVKTMTSLLYLTLPDGNRCVISDSSADVLEDLEERRSESELSHRHEYHPGQVLVGSYNDLQSADWLDCPTPKDVHSSKSNKVMKMRVDKVETNTVTVHWQCCSYAVKHEQPPNLIEGEDLKILRPLNVFESCTLQIGDRSFYHIKDTDTDISKDSWRSRLEWVLSSSKLNCKRKGEKTKADSKSAAPDSVDTKPGSGGSEGWETDEGDTASVSSGCSSSNSSAGGASVTRKKKTAGLMTKVLKFKKLRRTRRRPPKITLEPESRHVVETIMTSSSADVVWQDGQVETNIPSTNLYPIHHLDDQEFFPGDFVVESKETGCLRLYGVVQSVDHVGRLARVTWFHTYTSQQESEPKKLDTVEVSVYDLKDHPDFQYRPGTVALRVANCESDPNCASVGQVLDNYPEGRVHMWWVDGKTSMCWPQDLYKVGDYDSDEGELWDDNGSEGSWETESEEEIVDDNIKPLLAMNIEKARVSMSSLEDLFTHNPSLQSVAIMQKLLEVYRDCRYLDKLMGTSYFHENNFQGLLERVREKNKSSMVGQRISDQVARLSAPLQCSDTPCTESPPCKSAINFERVNQTLESLNNCLEQTNTPTESSANLGEPTETEDLKKSLDLSNNGKKSRQISPEVSNNLEVSCGSKSPDVGGGEKSPTDRSPNGVSAGSDKSPNSVTSGPLMQSSSQDDSGVFEHSTVSADASSNENCDCVGAEAVTEPRKGRYVFGVYSRASYGGGEKRVPRLSLSIKHAAPSGPLSSDLTEESNPCARLCALIKGQLCQAFGEVYQRFHGDAAPVRLSDLEKSVNEDETVEETPPTPGIEDFPLPIVSVNGEGFEVLPVAPENHKFRLGMSAAPAAVFLKTVRKELSLLRNALPEGIWVKGFEDRMDLYSIMIRGPEKTPYEDGLFLFDAQLPRDYPRAPPIFHYHSYCPDRLNPNLYEDGKVCVSLLGTWKGRGTEIWNPNSTLLQVIVSIQGLILVKEPYYNEAGYEQQKGSQQGHENSRMYNEMAVLKLVQAMTKLSQLPRQEFQKEIKGHFTQNAQKLIARVEKWLDISEKYNQDVPPSPGAARPETDAHTRNEQWQQSAINVASAADQPDFPLLPASRGFCITMRKTLNGFRTAATAS